APVKAKPLAVRCLSCAKSSYRRGFFVIAVPGDEESVMHGASERRAFALQHPWPMSCFIVWLSTVEAAEVASALRPGTSPARCRGVGRTLCARVLARGPACIPAKDRAKRPAPKPYSKFSALVSCRRRRDLSRRPRPSAACKELLIRRGHLFCDTL